MLPSRSRILAESISIYVDTTDLKNEINLLNNAKKIVK